MMIQKVGEKGGKGILIFQLLMFACTETTKKDKWNKCSLILICFILQYVKVIHCLLAKIIALW